MSISCDNGSGNSSLPRIQNIEKYSVTISWTTSKPISGEVAYYSTKKQKKKISEENATVNHIITIAGLLPGKQYYYKINSLPNREFNFRTASLSKLSFRFCIINNDNIESDVVEELFPDFLLLSASDNSSKKQLAGKFKELNTRIPFYNTSYSSIWGNLYFCGFKKSSGSKNDLLKNNIIVFAIDDSLPIITSYKENNNSRIVVYTAGDSIRITRDSLVTHFYMAGRSMLFEVQGDEVYAGIIGVESDKPLPFHLKKGALSYTKTCVLCRSLLENKQYNKSIAYYQRFIDGNPEQKLHDDALFHIATIYDRYLFDYPNAINAYKQLLSKYPQSSFSGTAGFRLKYIEQYSDFDYIPLKYFEKAKLQFGNDDKNNSVKKVEEILDKYKTCLLRDDILLWLGNILSTTDKEKAIKYLALLSENVNNQKIKYKASLKIGDIYYRYKEYNKAERIYTSMLSKYPDKSSTLQLKIDRSNRNKKRTMILWFCFVVLILLFGIAWSLPKRGFYTPSLLISVVTIFIYSLVFLTPFIFYYDALVTFQTFAISLFFSMVLIIYFSWLLVTKIENLNIPLFLKILINSMSTLLLTVCILFIHLYYFHSLYIFERLLL